MQRRLFPTGLALAAAACVHGCCAFAGKPAGVSTLTFRGFEGCCRIANGKTEVVVAPQSGGRLLSYALNGKDILYQDAEVDGHKLAPGKRFHPDAGRFDIGPEQHPTRPIPRRPALWTGKWTAEQRGRLAVCLTSQKCPSTGMQIQRLFRLAPDSSHLLVRQTMTNVSSNTTYWCFWSRTLAKGGGVCMVPLDPKSKFPKGYARYLWGGKPIETEHPEEPRLRVAAGLLTLDAVGEKSLKVGLDSSAEWMAYACDGLLFVKRFRYFPQGLYSDALGFSVAVYLNDRMCELEPISPQAVLKPGESYTFDEEWWLLDYPDANARPLDAAKAKAFVAANTARSN